MKTRKRSRTARGQKSLKCGRRHDDRLMVGTSGFMVSQSKWSQLACLNCIEINSTFYRVPTEKVVRGWMELPAHVGFVVKASKYITHIKRLKDVSDAWSLLWKAIAPLGKRLKCVLFQLPPSFSMKPENLSRITIMKKFLPKGVNIAFEFRNKSWFIDPVYTKMRKLKWCVVATFVQKTDGESWMGNMPSGLLLPPLTCDFSYLRVHGMKGYKGELGDNVLSSIRKSLTSQGPKFSIVMFNNTFFKQRSDYCTVDGEKIKYAAVCDAARFSVL